MTLTETDIEAIRRMIQSSVISSAGDPTRDINRVLEVKEIPAISSKTGSTGVGGSSKNKKKGKEGKDVVNEIKSTVNRARPESLLKSAIGITGIGAALALVEFIEPIKQQIIDDLQRPGGILDKRIKIDSTKMAAAEIDRQTAQNTRIGDRSVRIQQFEGFRNFEGNASTSTSRMIRENADRVLDIGILDKAQGV